MTLPNSAATFSVIDQLTLVADDGYRLAATRYSAQGNLKGNLIMAGATGVQQRFYRRFAEHSQQLRVVREIGRARRQHLGRLTGLMQL